LVFAVDLDLYAEVARGDLLSVRAVFARMGEGAPSNACAGGLTDIPSSFNHREASNEFTAAPPGNPLVSTNGDEL
jgi:hypothetical protein